LNPETREIPQIGEISIGSTCLSGLSLSLPDPNFRRYILMREID